MDTKVKLYVAFPVAICHNIDISFSLTNPHILSKSREIYFMKILQVVFFKYVEFSFTNRKIQFKYLFAHINESEDQTRWGHALAQKVPLSI